ncbi:MAG: GTPase Era [Rickettsiaceae bacterium]|nr:GTPase Era [Rickettsiaceae bacterium]
MTINSNQQKLLSICIIGKPNAGKSTLLNRVIGEKISIVTPKVQTTRSMITGIITLDNTQLILYDTPGIFEAKKKLEKAMVRCAWSSLNSADIVALIIDSTKPLDDFSKQIITRISSLNLAKVFLLNKIDRKSKFSNIDEEFLKKSTPKAKIFKISALNGHGIEDFLNFLKATAINSPWLYDQDELTNLPMRFLAAEITREQLFLNLEQELPYNLTVESELWQEQADGSVKINQVIIVAKESYKNMVIGKKGAMIKIIGTAARINIEKLVGCKIHLFLFVKVRKNWDSLV